jgi:hypothetical protein
MVQIRIKKTLSEGLLYVIICSKEINKPEDAALVLELLDGMYKELPEKKSAKAR